MTTYEGIADAADAARSFFYQNQGSLPAHVRDRIEPHVRTGSSPVDLITAFARSVYANREAVGPEGMVVAAGLAELINREGYHGRLDERAAGMRKALLRDAGEKAATGSPWPKKEADPAPDQEYLPPPEPEAPAAPAPAA